MMLPTCEQDEVTALMHLAFNINEKLKWVELTSICYWLAVRRFFNFRGQLGAYSTLFQCIII